MSEHYPQVVMLSLWRNDADSQLERRVDHLLSKTYPRLRWIWVVGDCKDDTEARLRRYSHAGIEFVRFNTGIAGDDSATRLCRSSMTASIGLNFVKLTDDYVVIHESDLISPPDVVERFIATGKCPVAGWPMLGDLFYDSWAYRAGGLKFSNYAPYHPLYQPDALIEVDSVGSCWMLHAEDVIAGVRCEQWGAVELCQRLKALGRRIWVDTSIRIEQPTDLFVSRKHVLDGLL